MIDSSSEGKPTINLQYEEDSTLLLHPPRHHDPRVLPRPPGCQILPRYPPPTPPVLLTVFPDQSSESLERLRDRLYQVTGEGECTPNMKVRGEYLFSCEQQL